MPTAETGMTKRSSLLATLRIEIRLNNTTRDKRQALLIVAAPSIIMGRKVGGPFTFHS